MARWYCLPLILILIKGSFCGQWGAWMPQSIYALRDTCVAIPCKFDYPDDIRPSVVHGVWYFKSPYPKNLPPVVLRTKTNTAHESFQGRTQLLGDLHQRNCTIQIDRLSSEFQGKYYFRADLGGYNQYTYSEHSNLELLDNPSILSPDEIIVGSVAELTCYAPDNCPDMKPIVTWFRTEGLEQQSVFGKLQEDNYMWTMMSLLNFLPTHKNNGHTVGCKVNYPNTSLEYEAFTTLDVKYPPKIVEVNSSLETTEGAHLILLCVVESNPMSLVTWMKDDTVLKEDLSANLTLEFENVTHNYDGIYICIAENFYGKVNRSLGLAVMYAPWKPSVNTSILAIEGEPVTILCSTEGNPEPIITIMKGKSLLSTAIYENELLLELPEVSHEDDGEYWCVAENQYGRSSSSFNITIEFAPIVLPESKCTLARDTVQCMCEVKSNPEPVILFEIPEKDIIINETDREFVYSQRNGYTVSSILTIRREPSEDILVICSASNLYGTKVHELEFKDANNHIWGKVGPVGAVFIFAILIGVVGYMIQTRKKKNQNESSSFVQTENPPVMFSGDYEPKEKREKSQASRS
ncbi:myelin-associated glycoprotein-like isoform X2 [Ambystoma mexicanum]|uniref:myelin-associated glycoprotein-like isoform X2 n=1 Tax=Ambystoma mexicanum TaxID=8296 RepID=UPI0037E73612